MPLWIFANLLNKYTKYSKNRLNLSNGCASHWNACGPVIRHDISRCKVGEKSGIKTKLTTRPSASERPKIHERRTERRARGGEENTNHTNPQYPNPSIPETRLRGHLLPILFFETPNIPFPEPHCAKSKYCIGQFHCLALAGTACLHVIYPSNSSGVTPLRRSPGLTVDIHM